MFNIPNTHRNIIWLLLYAIIGGMYVKIRQLKMKERYMKFLKIKLVFMFAIVFSQMQIKELLQIGTRIITKDGRSHEIDGD